MINWGKPDECTYCTYWNARIGHLFVQIASYKPNPGEVRKYDWFIMPGNDDKCDERAFVQGCGETSFEDAECELRSAIRTMIDNILRDL